jgi:hypothetical protein
MQQGHLRRVIGLCGACVCIFEYYRKYHCMPCCTLRDPASHVHCRTRRTGSSALSIARSLHSQVNRVTDLHNSCYLIGLFVCQGHTCAATAVRRNSYTQQYHCPFPCITDLLTAVLSAHSFNFKNAFVLHLPSATAVRIGRIEVVQHCRTALFPFVPFRILDA